MVTCERCVDRIGTCVWGSLLISVEWDSLLLETVYGGSIVWLKDIVLLRPAPLAPLRVAAERSGACLRGNFVVAPPVRFTQDQLAFPCWTLPFSVGEPPYPCSVGVGVMPVWVL